MTNEELETILPKDEVEVLLAYREKKRQEHLNTFVHARAKYRQQMKKSGHYPVTKATGLCGHETWTDTEPGRTTVIPSKVTCPECQKHEQYPLWELNNIKV